MAELTTLIGFYFRHEMNNKIKKQGLMLQMIGIFAIMNHKSLQIFQQLVVCRTLFNFCLNKYSRLFILKWLPLDNIYENYILGQLLQ